MGAERPSGCRSPRPWRDGTKKCPAKYGLLAGVVKRIAIAIITGNTFYMSTTGN